jgi:type IV pilus assembly protein PilC
MPEFVCRVGTPDGEIREEKIEAVSAVSARQELERKGYLVFRLQRQGALSLVLSAIGSLRPRPKVPKQTFIVFNQQLVSLLKAGLPLLQSIEILLERQSDPLFRAVLDDIREKIRSGTSLSDAFSSHGDLFPKLYATSLRAGEKSGELEAVLRRFLAYEKIIGGLRRRVVGALVYPAVLLVLSFGVIAVMMVYVIPKFTEFYAGFGAGKLPLITQVVIGTATFVRENLLLEIAAAVTAIGLIRAWLQTDRGKRTLHTVALRIPLIGQILQKYAVSQFCRSLATLLAGGNPLVPSLEIASSSVGNQRVAHRVAGIIQLVREGEPLWQSLEKTGEMTSLTLEMVKVGESTGALEEMLTNVADFYDEEIEESLSRLITLIEPLILVVMGGIVSTLLLSIYLPLFSLLSRVGGE